MSALKFHFFTLFFNYSYLYLLLLIGLLFKFNPLFLILLCISSCKASFYFSSQSYNSKFSSLNVSFSEESKDIFYSSYSFSFRFYWAWEHGLGTFDRTLWAVPGRLNSSGIPISHKSRRNVDDYQQFLELGSLFSHFSFCHVPDSINDGSNGSRKSPIDALKYS